MISLRSLHPEKILYAGSVYTLEPETPEVQAVAIRDGRILALGTDAEILALAGENTQCINLAGRAVLPGIFDSHNHLMQVGQKLAAIRLDECQSAHEMMELVRERARSTPAGEWIIGIGWNEGNFEAGKLPTRQDIDPATSDHPVLLMRYFDYDLVNSVGLRLAKVTRQTPHPLSGRIEKDELGEPNGLFRAGAKTMVRSLVPAPTQAEMQNWIRMGCQTLQQLGITSLIEPGLTARELQAYQTLRASGELSLRVNAMPSWHGFYNFETEAELDARARDLGVFSGLGDEWLRLGGLKMAIDGGTTGHTAWMYEPFIGETTVGAFNRLDKDTLVRHLCKAQELGWDVGVHTCGDRAQDFVVDAMAEAMRKSPARDVRHSIIHGYFPSEHAMQGMAENQIGAVIQPTFIYYEGELLFRDVGEARAHRYKPARSYLQHGIHLSASSDVESTVSANPFPSLYALITRKNRLGQIIGPDQGLSRLEALHTYTTAGTWLTREEALKGTLAPGKLADLIVLDQDYFKVSEESIQQIQVLLTLVGGQIVWQDPSVSRTL